VPDVTVQHQVALSRLTTFKNAGEIETLKVLHNEAALRDLYGSGTSFVLLGKGSNMVINPDGPRQLFVQISPDFFPVSVSGQEVTVSSGMHLAKFLQFCSDQGWSGLEFAAGVPASLGGMAVMNFGCWGQEMASYVKSVYVMNESGETFWVDKADIQYGYRDSIFQHHSWVILKLVLLLNREEPDRIRNKIRQYIHDRGAKQPLRASTFGSVFRNPEGKSAGQLIDSLGLRGHRFGGVKISEQHANFFENEGAGTFQDLMSAIEGVQSQVKTRYDILLQPEVKIIL